jgi:hypothetical protein
MGIDHDGLAAAMALPLLPVSAMVFLALVLVVFQVLHAVSTPSQDLIGRLLDAVQATLLEPGLGALGAPAVLRSVLIEGLWLGWGRERIRSRWPCGAALKGIVEEIVVKILS